MSLRENLGKIHKKKKKYLFEQKTKLKTSLKMVMTVLEIYLTK